MWARIKRIFRAIFGGMITSMEDPVMILQQNIRDMEEQVPVMNENIATVKANVTLLERDLRRLEEKDKELVSKMKAAINQSRDDLATRYAVQREEVQASKVRVTRELELGKKSYEKALEVKKAFLREKEKKTQEAMRAIQQAKQAQWQKKVADSMEQFQVGGIDQTHDEMIRKIDEESAVSEARMEMAMDNIDTDTYKIEEEAADLRAADMVKQMKLEMGLMDDGETAGGPGGQKEKA